MKEFCLNLKSLSFFAVFLLVMACLFGCSDTEPIMNEPINTEPIGTGTDSTKKNPYPERPDTLKTLDVNPSEWILGEWKLISSTLPNLVEDNYFFSSDGTYKRTSTYVLYDNSLDKYTVEGNYYFLPQQGIMHTVETWVVAPFDYCFRRDFEGYSPEDYGIAFTEDKMYLTAINAYFFKLYSYVYQRVQWKIGDSE